MLARFKESKFSDYGSKWNLSSRRYPNKTPNKRYQVYNFTRAYRSWFIPYIKSRIQPGKFRPLLSFLYTDLNCNLDCHSEMMPRLCGVKKLLEPKDKHYTYNISLCCQINCGFFWVRSQNKRVTHFVLPLMLKTQDS